MVIRSTNGHDEEVMKDLTQKLVIANQLLDSLELATPFGHISVRIPGTKTFLVARSVAPGMVTTADDILVCDLNGQVIEGKYKSTYGEIVIHTGVYRKREDFSCVAHTHSTYVIALSMAGNTVLQDVDILGSAVGPEPIALFNSAAHLSDPESGEQVADLFGPNNAVILRGHGAVVAGKSIEDVIYLARNLEIAAMYQWMARCVGKLVPITKEDKQAMTEFRKRAGPGSGMGADRAWIYWTSRLKNESWRG